MTDTTWTPYADLRLLHGARAGVSPEHMAAVFGTTVEDLDGRLRTLCGGEPEAISLTAAIRERSMPRPDLGRENRTTSREAERDFFASPREESVAGNALHARAAAGFEDPGTSAALASQSTGRSN